mmetsp:Transcript_11472/g.12589  ORF Transcript_11472/g.12589 Transcript_11472/m.12589 type:complete len:1077 (+) Transcript_11472:2-3232(+)
MKNLMTLRVLIVGVKGVGIETAKNLILAGPNAVTIHDNETVTIADLGTNFYLDKDSVGKKRSLCCIGELSKLNPYVDVTVMEDEITEEYLANFGAVVVTSEVPLSKLKAWNKFCHSQPTPILFLMGLTNGVTCSIFADYGPEHTVKDPNGEPARVNVVDHISEPKQVEIEVDVEGSEEKAKKTVWELLVTVVADEHKLDEDDLVSFKEVDGLPELNALPSVKAHRVYKTIPNKDPKKVRTVLQTQKFKVLLDSKPAGTWVKNGLITQLKQQDSLEFKSLEESLVAPKTKSDMFCLKHPENEKMFGFRADQLHFARIALWKFYEANNALPKLHSKEDAEKCVEIAKSTLEEHKAKEEGTAIVVEAIDEDAVRKMALYAAAELSGLCAFLGGLLAQEIVKKWGKYMPLHQWLYVDFYELLKDEVPADATPQGSRYDHQISIFGSAFQDKLFKQKWFLVGCGALGCEYLKGFALMGLGAKGGYVTVTDMDTIEVSNLNRQFLFRKENVTQAKSVCASNRARVMNPDMTIKCHETPVGPDTENVFNDAFWTDLDGVCNALDNVKARQYTDSKIVFFGKPLMESGTLGTKANTEIIIPHLTPSYSQHKDADEEDTIPMCTLRNFPHLIDHCIEWARAQFTDLFEVPAQDFNSYIAGPAAFIKGLQSEGTTGLRVERLQAIQDMITKVQSMNYNKCIEMAFGEFTQQYRNRIKDLIHAFPADARKKTKDGADAGPFWSGAKKFPTVAEFSVDSELHLNYLHCTANLFAAVFGVEQITKIDAFKTAVQSMSLKAKAWEPSKKALAALESEVAKEQGKDAPVVAEPEEEDDEVVLEELTKSLAKIDISSMKKLVPADFEKDDDTNFHIDFITAASNMRALNYEIEAASRHQCKMIAGKIVPAVATTTAMITGLVEIEMYKLVLGLDKKKLVCANINLGTSTYQLFEPDNAIKEKEEYSDIEMCTVKPVPEGFTCWDKIVVDKGDLTVEEFVKAIPEIHHGVKVDSINKMNLSEAEIKAGKGRALYLSFPMPAQKEQIERDFKRKLSDVYADTFGKVDQDYLLLAVACCVDDEPVKTPPVMYRFK